MDFEKSTPVAFSHSWIIWSDNWSGMSGIGFEIGCNSICVSLTSRVVSLVCLHIQLFLFQKTFTLQTNGQGYYTNCCYWGTYGWKCFHFHQGPEAMMVCPTFSILFMLKIDTCFISGILLVKTCNLSSMIYVKIALS